MIFSFSFKTDVFENPHFFFTIAQKGRGKPQTQHTNFCTKNAWNHDEIG